MKIRVIAISVLTVFVIVTIIAYQALSGALRKDQQAVSDLTAISAAVDTYYEDHSKLPTNLSEIKVSSKVTGRLDRYNYSVKKSPTYELCATFSHSADDSGSASASDTSSTSLATSTRSLSSKLDSHAKGKACYEQSASAYSSLYGGSSGSLFDDTSSKSNSGSLNSSSSADDSSTYSSVYDDTSSSSSDDSSFFEN